MSFLDWLHQITGVSSENYFLLDLTSEQQDALRVLVDTFMDGLQFDVILTVLQARNWDSMYPYITQLSLKYENIKR